MMMAEMEESNSPPITRGPLS